ncbi:hypothetical protein GBO34_00800 [Roseivirga pacifica]|uniref:DUF6712 family protein n=1 Tax=Roseivirga pacifica TaxID=1267423 RepID=UPI002095CD11|nr:DUF6712 family protein [Roseivirga pacifica]MCO6367851.1 hypothetical protein [Roseivirga pacifica]MCO6377223.1 hypothetical protein [Roseivirga pacifica]
MLFQSTAEFKKYVPVDAVTHFDSLSPFIEEAETLYIIPLLGDAMFATLEADYTDNDGTPATEANAKLLPYVQRCLAYYAAYLSIDEMAVNSGDAGFQQNHGDDSSPAPKYAIDNLKISRFSKGDIHAEKLLQYLEKTASPTVLNDWYASSANTLAEGLILRSAEQASQYIDINNSRRMFLRLKPRIKEIEQNFIAQLIGASQADEIATQIKNDSLKNNTENLALVAKLEPIIAKKALHDRLPFLRIKIDDQGISIITTNDSTITKMAANDVQVENLRALLRENSEHNDAGYLADIEKLKKVIEDNIDDYPLIENSGAYTAKADPGPKRPPNIDPTKKYVSV